MKESNISWTGSTWNPWHGCKKVSPGCKYCYMYRDKDRWKQDPTTVIRSKGKFNEPLKWKEPHLIFTCSWSDFFVEEADLWRREAWDVIRKTPQHTYQILTKRPDRIPTNLPPDWLENFSHVWIGTSIENQAVLADRYSDMLSIEAPKMFLSIEPLIGPVSLADYLVVPDGVLKNPIDWIIIGGESGNENGKYKYRKCESSWIKKIVDQCLVAKIPVFVKQLGTHISRDMKLKDDRHGSNRENFPTDINYQQFPIGFDRKKYK